MDASGTTISANTGKLVYYVIARNSGNNSTLEFPYTYSVVKMRETEAVAFSAMEQTVTALQRKESDLLLKEAARNRRSRTDLLFDLYKQLNCIYANYRDIIYICTEKSHQAGDVIHSSERMQIIGPRPNKIRQGHI